MKPLTAASHLWAKPRHPPGRCRDEAQNDRVPIWKQFKLESVEENKLANEALCVAVFPIRKSIATMDAKTARNSRCPNSTAMASTSITKSTVADRRCC